MHRQSGRVPETESGTDGFGGAVGRPDGARGRKGGLTTWRSVAWMSLLVLGATLPLWIPRGSSAYVLNLGILITIGAIGGLSFNLLGGFAGQVSFGHAAFYGVAAYSFARLFDTASISFPVALFLAALIPAVASVPVGLILLRLGGAYFALSMLAYAEVLRLVATVWRPATGGGAGLLFRTSFREKDIFYWIAFGVLLLCLALSWLVLRSRLGAYFLAIREDQDVAASLGIDVHRYKLIAFFLSAFVMGFAGALYAAYFSYLEPGIVFSGLSISLNVMIITLVGGLGTLWGPVVGAVILGLTTEASVVYLGQANMLAAGLLLVVVILRMPEGVVGTIQNYLTRSRGRKRQLSNATQGERIG